MQTSLFIDMIREKWIPKLQKFYSSVVFLENVIKDTLEGLQRFLHYFLYN